MAMERFVLKVCFDNSSDQGSKCNIYVQLTTNHIKALFNNPCRRRRKFMKCLGEWHRLYEMLADVRNHIDLEVCHARILELFNHHTICPNFLESSMRCIKMSSRYSPSLAAFDGQGHSFVRFSTWTLLGWGEDFCVLVFGKNYRRAFKVSGQSTGRCTWWFVFFMLERQESYWHRFTYLQVPKCRRSCIISLNFLRSFSQYALLCSLFVPPFFHSPSTE